MQILKSEPHFEWSCSYLSVSDWFDILMENMDSISTAAAKWSQPSHFD